MLEFWYRKLKVDHFQAHRFMRMGVGQNFDLYFRKVGFNRLK